MEPHHVLLYISLLATDVSVTEVASITRQARDRNNKNRITGVLAFDGMAFVQLLEGSEAELRELIGRIRHDPRHTDLEVLYFQPSTRPRRCPAWSMGYHFADSEDNTLERFYGLKGEEAMREFDRMAADLDVEAGVALPG